MWKCKWNHENEDHIFLCPRCFEDGRLNVTALNKEGRGLVMRKIEEKTEQKKIGENGKPERTLRERKCGAIWKKTTKAGKEKLSISLGDNNYIALPNIFKKGENDPNYQIFSMD